MSHVSCPAQDDASITTPFPVTHSILSSAALCSEILPLYELEGGATCLFLARGVNDTYLVQTPAEKYILRAYRTGWRTLEDILFEIDVLTHLGRQGMPVSLPVTRADGEVVCTLQAPEGPRQLVLFAYAPGRALDRHDASDTYYHGRALADLHNACDTFASTHTRAGLDLAYLIDHSLQVIQPLYTGSSSDWSYLLELAERLRSQIQHFAAQGLTWSVCHGDCHTSNDHIDADQTVTFFDFDCCAPGWQAYDLAIMRWNEGFYQMDPGDTLWQTFLKGYAERRPVPATDLASIPTFVALREIWHTALVAWLQPVSGSQEFDKIMHRTLRLLRAWEATQLS